MCTTTLTYDTYGRVYTRPDDRLAWIADYRGDNLNRLIQHVAAGQLRAFGKKEFHVVRNPRQISEHANRRKAS